MKVYKLSQIHYVLKELVKLEKQLHSLDEAQCNYGLTSRQEKRQENLVKQVKELAKRLGVKAVHQGDPRGGAVVLIDRGVKNYFEAKDTLYI